MSGSAGDTPVVEGGRRPRRVWAPEADLETAAVLRLLMVNSWLVAGRDDEAIAAVRRNLGPIREAFGRLGWVLFDERDFIRLRKSPPARRDAWATAGPSPLTCSWFFLLVAAAESMPPKVGIGQLVAAARAAAAEAGVPAPGDQPERYAIAAALKMLDKRRVVERIDGDIDGFIRDEDAPVLLAVHHTRLAHVIGNFGSGDPVGDPEGWLAQVEREPDPARRMRRRLVDDAVVYTADLDAEEADWLARRGRGDDGIPLATVFGLHLERRAEGAAFVVPDGAFRKKDELGDLPFPTGGTVAHAALLLCDAAAVDGDTDPVRPGWRGLHPGDVVSRLEAFGLQYGSGKGGWSKEDVDHPDRLAGKIAVLLGGLDLMRVDATGMWWVSPAAGRWQAPSAPRHRTRAGTTGSSSEPLSQEHLFDVAGEPETGFGDGVPYQREGS